jgi:hypothetical protein
MFTTKTRERKITKYQTLINNIRARRWNTTPLMVLAAGARAATHIPSMNKLETKTQTPSFINPEHI